MPAMPRPPIRNLFGEPKPNETAQAISPAEDGLAENGEGLGILKCIAEKIAATRAPDAASDIPAGITYLTQFALHDLDFVSRETGDSGYRFDLSLIYGEGPLQDSAFYQVPAAPGTQRFLLRLNRTRPTEASPPWGAARDLPRIACPHLDHRGLDARTDVLVPNNRSDSNLLLGQVHTLWVLTHNAIASTLVALWGKHGDIGDSDPYRAAFQMARRINRGIYRTVLCEEVLPSWIMPGLQSRYATRDFRPLSDLSAGRPPVEFMAGVGRIGHCLVRDIYRINQHRNTEGLRNILRQTSLARPLEMPLTEDWLVDFSGFYAIKGSIPQYARVIGPHMARALNSPGTASSDRGLVLRDLIACTRSELRSVASLIAQLDALMPGYLDGHFAGEAGTWQGALRIWLEAAGLTGRRLAAVMQDPPLTLFLMLEAENDTGGRRLGALGSFIFAEALTAALPAVDEAAALQEARRHIFGDRAPGSMSAIIEYLQAHYGFADGARLHNDGGMNVGGKFKARGDHDMLDSRMTNSGPDVPQIKVADHVEMGRLVTEWATGRRPRPETVEELKRELRGIAEVPDRIKRVEFCQDDEETLVIRLPIKATIERAVDEMADPEREGNYPFPQFYSDFFQPGFSPVMSPLDILMARVGDHTLAQCP